MPRFFDPATPELMDVPQPASAELAVDLRNLERLNRWFGAHRLLRPFLARWLRPAADGRPLRLLDLCTGGADLPRLMAAEARRLGVPVAITAVDFQPGTVELARRWCADWPEIDVVQGDARTFGADGQTWDYAFTATALHHFSAADAAAVLARMRTLTTRGALAADLRRGPTLTAGVWAMTATLMREPMTVADARTSARAAWSFAEFGALAQRAGWEGFSHARFPVGRQGVWIGL